MSQTYPNVTVLVVDDNEGMRTILLSLIRALGFPTIRLAENGDEARKLLPEVRPDMIIYSLKTPIKQGLDFLHWLRHDENNPYTAVPIIVVSGDTDQGSVKACLEAGVNQILARPVTGKAMANRIEHLILDQTPFVRTETYAGPKRAGMSS